MYLAEGRIYSPQPRVHVLGVAEGLRGPNRAEGLVQQPLRLFGVVLRSGPEEAVDRNHEASWGVLLLVPALQCP